MEQKNDNKDIISDVVILLFLILFKSCIKNISASFVYF